MFFDENQRPLMSLRSNQWPFSANQLMPFEIQNTGNTLHPHTLINKFAQIELLMNGRNLG